MGVEEKVQQTPEEQKAMEKLALIEQYAPELKQGVTQIDVDGVIARLSVDKAIAERHINTLVDRLIAACQERDKLMETCEKQQRAIEALLKAANKGAPEPPIGGAPAPETAADKAQEN